MAAYGSMIRRRAPAVTSGALSLTRFGRPIGPTELLPALGGVAGVALGAVVWTLIAYWAGPLVALALPIVVVVLALVAVRPMTGVYLGILCVPLEQLGFTVGAADVTPAKGLLFYTGVVAAAHFLLGLRRARPHPGHVAFGLLVLFGVVGVGASEESLTTLKILAQWGSYLWLSLYVATAERPQLDRMMACLVLAGAIVGTSAMLSSGEQEVIAGGQAATGRAQASFDHPATLAFFLVLAFPPALVLGFRGRGLLRIPALGAGGLCIAGIMLSLTRGAILGAVVAILVMLFWTEFRRTALVLLVALFAFSAFNLQAIERSPEVRVVTARLQTITDTRATQDNQRVRIWSKTPGLIADHPFLGIGAGDFATVSARYGIVDAFGQPFVHAHDVLLTIAAEFGLIGLALFVFFVAAIAREAIRMVPRHRGSPSFPMTLALAAALAGLFVNGITDYPPATLVIMGTFMAVAGAFIGYVRVLGEERAASGARAPA